MLAETLDGRVCLRHLLHFCEVLNSLGGAVSETSQEDPGVIEDRDGCHGGHRHEDRGLVGWNGRVGREDHLRRGMVGREDHLR